MIRAVIFDCFGVLTSEAWLAFKSKHFDHDDELVAKVNEISRMSDSGLISRADAIKQTSALAGMTPEDYVKAVSNYVPNEPLFDYIQQLKPNYKVGLLSNISDNYLHKIFSE